MAQRQLTDAWGDRWDAFQDDSQDLPLTITFRHQSGTEVSTAVDASLHSLSTQDLLGLLETARQQAGVDRSVLRGIDAKEDPEGYVAPESEPDVRRHDPA